MSCKQVQVDLFEQLATKPELSPRLSNELLPCKDSSPLLLVIPKDEFR